MLKRQNVKTSKRHNVGGLRTFSRTFALLAVVLLVLIGCGGPTKKGLEARSAAADRVNMVNAQVSFDQARRSFETGDLERALREINGALARYDDVAEYHVLRGRVLFELHRLEASMRSFATALELDPQAIDAHYYSGIINQRWSRHEDAYQSYLGASELDGERVSYLLAAAESLIALGRYEEAGELVQSRLSRHEHNASLRQLLGHIAMLKNDPTAAAAYFEEARLLNPDDAMLLEELARARFDAGQYSRTLDAIEQLYLVDRANEGRNDLRHFEARTLARMNRYVEARRIYIRLADQTPGDADLWIELAAVALELGDDRRLDQGSARAITIAPLRHEGYLLRALYEQERGRFEQAERLFQQAIDLAEGRPRASSLSHMLLGQLLERRGRKSEARHHYATASNLHPQFPEPRALLARLVESNPNAAEGRETLSGGLRSSVDGSR